MSQKKRSAKFPYAILNVWDYDEAGSSDSLGTTRLYLHKITEVQGGGIRSIKQRRCRRSVVPRRRVVRMRKREGGLCGSAQYSGSVKERLKLDGLPPSYGYCDCRAWFHGLAASASLEGEILHKNSKAAKLSLAILLSSIRSSIACTVHSFSTFPNMIHSRRWT